MQSDLRLLRRPNLDLVRLPPTGEFRQEGSRDVAQGVEGQLSNDVDEEADGDED